MYPPLPMRLVEIRGDQGIIETGEERYPVHLHFLDNIHPGEHIIVQLGFGIQAVGTNSESGKTKPALADLRKKIEEALGNTERTILLTSEVQVANPQFHPTRYSLPPHLNFLYGPGCPACLTPTGYYRNVFRLAEQHPVIMVTLNDVMNMPTPDGTLQSLRMAGNDIRLVHSPFDVLRIAEWNPAKEVVLAAVGCDIMAATIGVTMNEAIGRGIQNLSFIHSLQRRDILIREFIVRSPRTIDGVICSLHDVNVIGADMYKFVADELNRACSCAGFTVEEVMEAVLNVILQVNSGKPSMQDKDIYTCTGSGNSRMRSVVKKVFDLSDSRWATGEMTQKSRYVFRDEYRSFDAAEKFHIPPDELPTMPGCHGQQIQLGMKIPSECPHFATKCTPKNPVGAGMITSEGLCHSWYHSSIKVKISPQ